jgi:hypothetical protein
MNRKRRLQATGGNEKAKAMERMEELVIEKRRKKILSQGTLLDDQREHHQDSNE